LNALERGGEDTLRLESLYTRSTQINRQPVNDSYHFGQTIINTTGVLTNKALTRPTDFRLGLQKGVLLSISRRISTRPSGSRYSQSIQNLIATLDQNPVQPAAAISSANQFRLLDTYVSTSLAGWDFAFGKQSLWWGQGKAELCS